MDYLCGLERMGRLYARSHRASARGAPHHGEIARGMISHRTLLRFALSGGHAFAWIFVFQFYTTESGDVATGFVVTLLAYALSHTIAILATPLGARLLRRGTTRMMRNATLALSAAFLVLAASLIGLFGSVQIGVLVFAIGTGLYRALYWVPYSQIGRAHV